MKRQLLWILLILLLIGGWFYWFQYRVTKIRGYCVTAAQKRAQQIKVEEFKSQEKINSLTFTKEEQKIFREITNQFINQGIYDNNDYESEYSTCLRSNGLKN